jgi:hypothetical protein
VCVQDYKDFLAEFNRIDEEEGGSNNIWIMKPVGSSRGRGIFLISDLNDVSCVTSLRCACHAQHAQHSTAQHDASHVGMTSSHHPPSEFSVTEFSVTD